VRLQVDSVESAPEHEDFAPERPHPGTRQRVIQAHRMAQPRLEAAGHKVIVPDMPSHGRDWTPPGKATMQMFVETYGVFL